MRNHSPHPCYCLSFKTIASRSCTALSTSRIWWRHSGLVSDSIAMPSAVYQVIHAKHTTQQLHTYINSSALLHYSCICIWCMSIIVGLIRALVHWLTPLSQELLLSVLRILKSDSLSGCETCAVQRRECCEYYGRPLWRLTNCCYFHFDLWRNTLDE